MLSRVSSVHLHGEKGEVNTGHPSSRAGGNLLLSQPHGIHHVRVGHAYYELEGVAVIDLVLTQGISLFPSG